MVRRVPRPVGRANARDETAFRTHVRSHEPESRETDPIPPTRRRDGGPRYRACTVSCVASYRSPRFHNRNVSAASFRASVTRASSSRIPRASNP